ncbi:MAG: hypothetical protein DCC71_13000 [Proteobacteria bacterium]|nr:MAG: hypothetical protein DCC71_13000 [Pseudomonadota bacterium]
MLPEACRREATLAREATALGVGERWIAACGPGGLVGRTLGVTGLDATRSDALLRVALADGRVVQHVLRSDAERFVVPARTPRLAVARDYARLGIEHIATGTDHLLFVLGLLLLVGGGRRLVQTITAFTLGHSATLSLAALGFVRFPSRPIEVAIAASVLWLAVELAQGERDSWLRRAPWLAAGCFGLLHGLGFAGTLAETGLPSGEIPLALLSFNAGIEAGQLAFVAVALAPLSLLRSPLAAAPAWLARAPVYAMGSLAAAWCFERAALLLP